MQEDQPPSGNETSLVEILKAEINQLRQELAFYRCESMTFTSSDMNAP